ncbi:hypothetical protein ACFY7Z_12410 [Streptomyces sp. NPDC012623]|uniref:hypothetical protein n=1 Tax=unclassified Streptomyces TaxID=2593676 RepID=UPI0036886F95
MGWTVLYIAFGIVALWLLGEVLLQYKARLRWRLLAFAGFLVVVLGVLIPQVFVIAVGAIAFAVGQTYVTLSFRRGFATGWSIGGSPRAGRRRRASSAAADREPALEVSDLEYEPVTPPADAAPAYGERSGSDDTGPYGGYDDAPAAARSEDTAREQGSEDRGSQQSADGWGTGFDAYPGYQQYSPDQTDQTDQDVFAPRKQDGYADQDSYGNQDAYAGKEAYAAQDAYSTGYPGQDAYAAQDAYAPQYDYGNATGDQRYAAYSDPYVGSSQHSPAHDGHPYGPYDGLGEGPGDGRQQYADPYDSRQYAGDTPPGGVWVPQQRERDENAFPPLPGEQPQQQGYDPHYNDQQYRY